jgi:hypothetical protein
MKNQSKVPTQTEKKLQDFADLLDSLDSTEDKKKLLWREAYQNALEDRASANILVTDLLLQVRGNITNHQTYGVIMTKYLERMSKSNDQILKLAELVAKEQEGLNVASTDDIFNEIGS